MVGGIYIPRMEGEVRSLRLSGPSSWVTQQACPLSDLLQHQEMVEHQGGRGLGLSTSVWGRALLPAPALCQTTLSLDLDSKEDKSIPLLLGLCSDQEPML